MGELTVHVEPVSDRAALANRWTALEHEADISFFQSWLWIGAWLDHIGDQARPRVLRWTDGDRDVGLAVICGRDRYALHRFPNRTLFLHESGWGRSNFVIEYNGLVIRRGYEQAVAESMLDWFLAEAAWSELVLSAVRAEDPLLAAATRRGMVLVDELNRSPCWYVDLTGLRAQRRTLLQSLGKNSRYQIRRQLRRLAELGEVRTDQARTVEEAHAHFDGLKEFHQRYWQSRGRSGSFANPRWEAFHRDVITAGLGDGRVQLLRFSAGEKPLGYIYTLVHRGHVAMLQSGFNYAEFEDYQVGLVCNSLAVEWNLDLGMTSYDFLAGDAQYKRRLAKDANELCWVALRRKTLKNRLEHQLLRVHRRLDRKSSAE
ncbi:MAG: GNAT family N-acetyltransferase [Ectothiorhodospiraceae bacterium]|nr:GNAT family N-acetyltransferase [Ectothiorhodospiraceae bacterium]